jgi:hypothetical protein
MKTYTDTLASELCECIAGGDSAREAAKKYDITEGAIRFWRRTKPDFATQYAHAVQDRADVFFERGNDIAFRIKSGEESQIARVQLDWLKWAACKMFPKAYGDKVTQEHSGPDGGPIQASVTVNFVKTGEKPV